MALPAERLKEVSSHVKDYDVIGVDEGQFFPDLVEAVEEYANLGKIVIIAALDGFASNSKSAASQVVKSFLQNFSAQSFWLCARSYSALRGSHQAERRMHGLLSRCRVHQAPGHGDCH